MAVAAPPRELPAPRTAPALPARQAPVARPALRALAFVAIAAGYGLVGARLAVGLDVVAPDAIDRLARAYLAWHGAPAKLATIGFGAPPLPALGLVPFALIGGVATSLAALPAFGALCGAATLLALDRTLARCGLRGGRRAALVAAFALNPLVAFQFTTGTPAALTLALLAAALRGLTGWGASGDPRGLLGAGVAFAGLLLTRYELAAWGLVALLVVPLALAARGARREEAEDSAAAFGAPAVAALAAWVLLAAAIVDAPLGWVRDAWRAGTPAGLDAGDVAGHTLELLVLAFPLAFLAMPVLLARRDGVGLGLAATLAGGTVLAALHAYTADGSGPIALGAAPPLLLVALVGLAWVYRRAGSRRTALWAAALAVLVAGAAGAWRAAERYPYANGGERAWARALRSGEDQGTTAAAREIGRALRAAAPGRARVLTDEAATGPVVVLSERPSAFLTRAGAGEARWRATLARPAGRVDYVVAARGDDLDRAHPGLLDGRARELVVVAAAGPYVLARVL